MGYVFQNIHGVLTVRDESTLNEPKQIRFIDPHYNEKFKIDDGGSVKIHYSDGVKKRMYAVILTIIIFALVIQPIIFASLPSGWKSWVLM